MTYTLQAQKTKHSEPTHISGEWNDLNIATRVAQGLSRTGFWYRVIVNGHSNQGELTYRRTWQDANTVEHLESVRKESK